MYKLEILPIAKNDIEVIINYISHNLKNISAAKRLRNLFDIGFNNILEFPYGCSICEPIIAFKNEYRRYRIKNFFMVYTIAEDKKIITIVRVLYQKKDINSIL